MKISADRKLGFDDVMIVPRRSNIKSRSEVNLEKTFYFYHSPRELTCVPIFCSNMASIAGPEMAYALYVNRYLTALHKYLSIEDIHKAIIHTGGLNSNCVFMSIGMRDSDFQKLEYFVHKFKYSPNLCLDVPNGHIEAFINHCARVRNLCPDSIIMAGNVVTPEAVQELIIYGKADIVKLGIGPGSFCETRKKTKVGYPQVSCSLECSIVAHGLKSKEKHLGLVCLDGGFKTTGDMCVGFVSGSDFLMSANMFAGCDECCGEWEYGYKTVDVKNYFLKSPLYATVSLKCKQRMKHYGMSSHYAQEKHEGVQKDYRTSEGKVEYIPYKGKVVEVIKDINGSLRSCASYIGANTIRDFNKCGSFIQV